MKIFVAVTFLVIAAVIAKDLRIESNPGLGLPGSGMAYKNFWHYLSLFSIMEAFHLYLISAIVPIL